jgi:hypothetical protein
MHNAILARLKDSRGVVASLAKDHIVGEKRNSPSQD